VTFTLDVQWNQAGVGFQRREIDVGVNCYYHKMRAVKSTAEYISSRS